MLAAANAGDAKALSAAIASGADVDASQAHGWTATIFAAWHDHDACLRTLIAHGADIHAKNNQGQTATIFAARNGHEACLRALIAHGADIHAKDNQGRTAAMLAAEYGSPDLAALTENLALARDEASALPAATPAIPPSPRPPRI